MTSYTLAQYRALKDPIKNEGPWALEGNPHRPFRTSRKAAIVGGCMHITVGLTDLTLPDVSAENTTNWGRNTPDASWSGIVDSDSIIPSLRDSYAGWTQGVSGYSFNDGLLGLEIGKLKTDWRIEPSTWVEATIRNAAAWFAPRHIRYGWPYRVVKDRDEVQRHILRSEPMGYTQHGWLSPGTRSDAGLVLPSRTDTFPWDMFLDMLREEVAYRGEKPPVKPPSKPPVKPKPKAPPFPLPKGYYFGPKEGPVQSVSGYYSHRDDLRRWQTQMAARGWTITADGLYGPQTKYVAAAFGAEKHLGPRSDLIGPVVWAAAWTAPVT